MTRDARYSRQVRFRGIGAEGQRALGRSSVLLVGVGAVGSHVASSLCRAGVGELLLVDRDVVELDNLPRQLLFDEQDARHGTPKAIAAARHLERINRACRLSPIVEDFDAAAFERLERRPDLIVDGTDNFPTRYLINDLAVRGKIPWIYGGAVGSLGRAMAVLPFETPCLRCLLPTAPPSGEIGTCETEGILEPAVAQVAAFQTAQALKILTGQRDAVARGTFVVDVWSDSHAVRLPHQGPAPECASCGTGELPALRSGPPRAISLCGRDAVQVRPAADCDLDLERLARNLAGVVEDIELTPYLLRFRAEDCRFSVFRGGRALLFGTAEPARARTLYDRYVGAG